MSLCLNSNNEALAGICQLNAHYCTGCVTSAKQVADLMIQRRDEKIARYRGALEKIAGRCECMDASKCPSCVAEEALRVTDDLGKEKK